MQIEELTTESDVTVFNIEPEMNFKESHYPSRRMPEHWDRLGSSKSRSHNQQEESMRIIGSMLSSCNNNTVEAETADRLAKETSIEANSLDSEVCITTHPDIKRGVK